MLILMSKGLARKEIGPLLAISPNTVNDYVKTMLLKLQVHRREEAIVIAVKAGLV